MNRFTLVIALTSVMGFAGCRIHEDGVADGGDTGDTVELTAEEAILSDRTVQPSNSEGFGAAIRTAASSEVDTRCNNGGGGGDCGTEPEPKSQKQGGNVFQGHANIISVDGDGMVDTAIGFLTLESAGNKVHVNLIRDEDGDTSRFDLQSDDVLEDFYGNNYYYFSNIDTEDPTLNHGYLGANNDDYIGEVLVRYHPLSATSPGDNFLVAGTWLVQIPDSDDGRMEVFSFALVHGDQIDATNLLSLTGTATYGATGDGAPEASGYFFSADGELSRFLADAVLTVNFETITEYGAVSGQISSTSDYPGQDFTLSLGTGDIVDDDNYPNAGKLRKLVFKGATAGETGGALVDEEWAGTWGGKLYGRVGDVDDVPDFVYGTFGACDTGDEATCIAGGGSLIGAFTIFDDNVEVLTADEVLLNDRTVQPSNPGGFETAIHAAASDEVDTRCIDGGGETCGIDAPKDGGLLFQGFNNIVDRLNEFFIEKGLITGPGRIVMRRNQRDSTILGLSDGEKLDLHGNDYYYFSDAEGFAMEHYQGFSEVDDGYSGEVLVQHHDLDDDDFLVAGTWLVQIPDSADGQMEVFTFASVRGDQIEEDLEGLTGTATYGATGDGIAEASGYFFSADGELSRFFADAVLMVNFGIATEYGAVSGQISSTSDYPGQDFTLSLEAGDIVDDGYYPNDDKLRKLVFKGATAGETGGALVDEEWSGTWGGKLYGGDGMSAPDFVYGTFGACDTGSGVTCTADGGSLIGAFTIFDDNVEVLTAEEVLLSDRTVQPSNPDGFETAIHAAASSTVATTCFDEDGDSCEDFSWNGNVYQSSPSNIDAVYTRTQGGDNSRLVHMFRTDGYFRLDYEQGELLEDLYGNEYHYFKGATGPTGVNDHTADALIQHVPVSDDDDFLVAGTWLVQIPDSAGDRMEVVSFALPFADEIEENLGPLTVTVTYGATGDETPEASGYFFANNVLTRFLADAELTVDFGDASALGKVSGQITNADEGGYPGPAFTLELGTGTIGNDPNVASTLDELRGLVFNGDTAGEMDGALVDDDWAGKWGGKVYGGAVGAAPDFVYGTFGACDTGSGTTCTAGGGSLIGAFIAPQAPPPSP